MAKPKLALVTDAAGGMGVATINRLVADGYHVAAMDINEVRLTEAITTLGSFATAWPCDQTNETQTRDTVQRIITR